MNKVLELSDETFDQTINSANLPVLVDFYAPWCGHCNTQSPIIEDLAQELADSAVIVKINVDENCEKASEYFISGIPAILLFKNGKLVEQKAGFHNKGELKKLIGKYQNN